MQGSQEGKRILIIDDDKNACRSLSFFLDHQGFETVTAFGADDGMQKFFESAPSLVLLDVFLPQSDGFEVCRRIKETSIGQKVPVVLMSAYYSEDKITPQTTAVYGAADYLVKPLAAGRLINLINKLIERQEREEANGTSALSGDLKHLSFASLLGMLYSRHETGVLTLFAGGQARYIYFIDGKPVYIHRNSGDSDADTGKGNREPQLPAEVWVRQTAMRIGSAMLECFCLTDGVYYFSSSIDFVEDIPMVDLEVEKIIREGMRQHCPNSRIRSLMSVVNDWKLKPSARFEEIAEKLDFRESDHALMRKLDGSISVKDLLAQEPEKSREQFSLLYTLLILGALESSGN